MEDEGQSTNGPHTHALPHSGGPRAGGALGDTAGVLRCSVGVAGGTTWGEALTPTAAGLTVMYCTTHLELDGGEGGVLGDIVWCHVCW